MQRRTLATALQALILTTSAMAALHTETVSARTVTEPRSVYSDGARSVQEERSAYTDGARDVLDSRSVYSDGDRDVRSERSVFTDGAKGTDAFTTAGMDRTGVSAPPGGAA